MSEWQHQVRLYLDEAERRRLDDKAHALHAALRAHEAILVSQLDAFEAYLSDPAQAAKREKHRLALAVRVGGAEVYDRDTADAVEAELRPFVADGTVLRLSRHDTDPQGNLAQSPHRPKNGQLAEQRKNMLQNSVAMGRLRATA